MALIGYSSIIVFGILGFISDQYLNSRPLTILFLVLLLAPVLFVMSFMNYFTRKVTVQLDTDEISFTISNLGTDEEEQMKKYKLLDVASYQIQFPNDMFACLILKFKSGNTKEFSFRRKIFSDTQSDTNSVIEAIHKTLQRHQIEFAPSFWASENGLYTLTFLASLTLVPIVLAIRLDKNLPLTFLGSVTLIGHLFTRRMTDLNFYKRWKKS
jgi:hypothetical protein